MTDATLEHSSSDTQEDENFVQTDEVIENRDRLSRALVAILLPFGIFFFGYSFGVEIAQYFKLYPVIGQLLGVIIGGGGSAMTASKSYVSNDSFIGLLTTDPVVALIGGNPYVSYGPGFHFRFPWEQPSATGVVSLKESTEKIETEIQGGFGTFRLNGSFRMRPDLKRLPEYIAGAGAVIGDTKDLIISEISEELANTEVQVGIKRVLNLNQRLLKLKRGEKQDEKVSGFEKRFGVMMGDVTIATIKASEEVQKALDGAAESTALSEVIARNLGYPDIKAVHDAVTSGKLKSEEVATATKIALAMTDNLHGMKVTDTTYNVKLSGEPEMVSALGAIAPALISLFPKNPGGKK